MGATATTSAKTQSPQLHGSVLKDLQSLLADGKTDAAVAKTVVDLFSKLVKRNSDLERQLGQLLIRGRKSEGVSSDQLALFLDALAAQEKATNSNDDGIAELTDANARLGEVADAEKLKKQNKDEQTKPPTQPPLRQPAPAHLPRIENRVAVSTQELKCPKCGDDRACIGYDRTEVIDLEPAKIVVRVDLRQKLACKPCEGQLVRAPMGDKVVAGGKLGATFVGHLIVDKYDDGLPLHREQQRFERMSGIRFPTSTLADQITWGTDLLRPLWHVAIEVSSTRRSCISMRPHCPS